MSYMLILLIHAHSLDKVKFGHIQPFNINPIETITHSMQNVFAKPNQLYTTFSTNPKTGSVCVFGLFRFLPFVPHTHTHAYTKHKRIVLIRSLRDV